MFKRKQRQLKTYDPTTQKPVLKCSICNGEQVAGFRDLRNGRFEEVMLIRGDADLREFCRMYGLTEPIRKIY